jgi:hypothetical protein
VFSRLKIPVLACLALFIVRLPVIGCAGLGDSEAYYWAWSQHLDLSYFDHPPAVAYVIRAGTGIFGDTPFGVRFVPTLMTTGALFALYLAGELLGGPVAGLMTMLALLCKPLFVVAGVSAAPDSPLSLFTALALYFYIRARRSAGDPGVSVMLSGLFFGLGFLSKYSALMLLPGVVAALALPHNRGWWKRPPLYAGFLLCAAAATPVIVWNLAHTWGSVTYHLVSRQSAAGFSLANTGKLIGGQIGYFSPFILAGFFLAILKAARARKEDPLPFEVVLIGLPAVLFFYLVILVTPNAEPHWPLAGYVYLAAVLGWAVSRAVPPLPAGGTSLAGMWAWWGSIKKPLRTAIAAAVAYTAAVVILAHVLIFSPLFVRVMPDSYNPKYDITNELYGWDALGPRVLDLYGRSGDKGAFLLAYHYTMCGQLMFATHNEVELRCLTPRKNQFNFFPGADGDFTGRNAFYVRDNRYKKDPQEMYRFDSCESLEKVPYMRGGKKVREFEIYYCRGYRGLR